MKSSGRYALLEKVALYVNGVVPFLERGIEIKHFVSPFLCFPGVYMGLYQ